MSGCMCREQCFPDMLCFLFVIIPRSPIQVRLSGSTRSSGVAAWLEAWSWDRSPDTCCSWECRGSTSTLQSIMRDRDKVLE